MYYIAAGVAPPCRGRGRLSTGIGAAVGKGTVSKSIIELGRTNNWVENRPRELPSPCRVSRLTQQVRRDSGKRSGSISHCFPTHRHPSTNCMARLLH